MPLAGLVLNRTHPTLSSLSPDHATSAADTVSGSGNPDDELAAGILRVHADRARTAARELTLLRRFTAAHPRVPVVGVPSLPFEVSDLTALRAVGDQLTGTA